MLLDSTQGYVFLIIIIVETILLIATFVWHFLSSNDANEKIKSLEYNKQSLLNQLHSCQYSLNNYARQLDTANANLRKWQNWYAHSNHSQNITEKKANVIEFDIPQKSNISAYSNQPSYKYLQEANEGKFLKLISSPEKCYFRTWEEGGVLKYEFFGNVAKALANINAIFDDVCEIEGKRSGATDIENVSAGTLDSELRITSKAKIRLK